MYTANQIERKKERKKNTANKIYVSNDQGCVKICSYATQKKSHRVKSHSIDKSIVSNDFAVLMRLEGKHFRIVHTRSTVCYHQAMKCVSAKYA